MVYKAIKVSGKLPEYIEQDIQEMLKYLNDGGDPLLADVYRDNLRADLNCCKEDVDEADWWAVRNYYCRGDIFGGEL